MFGGRTSCGFCRFQDNIGAGVALINLFKYRVKFSLQLHKEPGLLIALRFTEYGYFGHNVLHSVRLTLLVYEHRPIAVHSMVINGDNLGSLIILDT